jgi:hypothetical protein
VAIVHFIKVVREERKNNTDLTKAIVYLAGGITLAMLLLYKPFGASVIKIADKLVKRPFTAATDAVMITTSTIGATSVSV